MRLVLTADLHRDGKKLLWLLDEAPAHDALLVAGDLLDIFSDTGMTEQRSGALRWRDAVLKGRRSFAWCSGNHDFFHGDHTPMAAASPFWMRENPSTGRYVTDGESRILEAEGGRIVVTTLPWPVQGGELVIDGYRTSYRTFADRLLALGRKLKEEENLPWIVLNHEPPGGTPLCGDYSAPEADFTRRLIEAAQPDFSLHGHVHDAPSAPAGSWIWQVGETITFNAGQSPAGEPAHRILLDWAGRNDWQATWFGGGSAIHAFGRNRAPDA